MATGVALRQLKAILWKNLLLKKAHTYSTCAEVKYYMLKLLKSFLTSIILTRTLTDGYFILLILDITSCAVHGAFDSDQTYHR